MIATTAATGGSIPLSRNLSLYIDLMRVGAAAAVFLSHTQAILVPDLSPVFVWGREAVVVFFVLSGFVIDDSTARRPNEPAAYLIARVARIVPVAALALGITALVNWFGGGVDVRRMPDMVNTCGAVSFATLASSLAFVNQLWFQHVVFGCNEPYWSLGFEVQYYALFFLFSFLSGSRRVAFIGLWCIAVGPNILLYLPIWLAGVWTRRRLAAGLGLRKPQAVLALLLSLIVIIQLRIHIGADVTPMFDSAIRGQTLVNVLYFYLVGLCTVLHILAAASFLEDRSPMVPGGTAVVRWLAGGSFTLYLVHQPLLLFVATGPAADAVPTALGKAFVALAASFALAELAERRKAFIARKLWAAVANRGHLVSAPTK